MSTILEYLVLTLGLTCIIIGVGGWLLPYLQRLRQRGWSLNHDPDDDDPEVRGLDRDADDVTPPGRVALWPPAAPTAAAPVPAAATPTPATPSAVSAAVATSSVVRTTAPAAVADEEEEDMLADVDLEGVAGNPALAPAAADEAATAPVEAEADPLAAPAEDDFMSLFAETAAISKVPDVLKNAVEPVTMDALLEEARELQRLLSPKP